MGTKGWTTKRRRSWMILLILSVAMPASVAAQESKRDRVTAMFSAAELEQIDAIAARAAGAGVVADPIYDKALEGAAKRVPVERILPALEAYATRLEDAQGLLGATATPAAVVAGADALGRGVSRDAVRAVGQDAGERSPVALVVLGDLADAGIPADGALAAVRQALQRDQAPDALLHVPAAVRRLMRDGQAPDRAINDVTRLMRDGVPPQRIRDGRPGQG